MSAGHNLKKAAAKAALVGMFVGDALAMPVHWFYDLSTLSKLYGRIQRYEPPPKPGEFPASIMNLSAVDTGGRGSYSSGRTIVGDVILHGKKEYWKRKGANHYHCTLSAGENTLEMSLVRPLLQVTFDCQKELFDVEKWLTNYVLFMTTPGTHNDAYAATAHRMFFANYEKGLPLSQCADNDGHNTDSIDGLTHFAALVLVGEGRELPAEQVDSAATEVMTSIRRTTRLLRYTSALSCLLRSSLDDSLTLREAAEMAANALSSDMSVAALASRFPGDKNPMTACYIDTSFTALLIFIWKYGHLVDSASGPETAWSAVVEGLLASTNAGGENVARGCLLGAVLFGRAFRKFPDYRSHNFVAGHAKWMVEGLKDREGIFHDVDLALSV